MIQLLAVYLLAPYALAKQGTYGVLGVAAALLLGLFILGRLIVAAAKINATLWATGAQGTPRPDDTRRSYPCAQEKQ